MQSTDQVVWDLLGVRWHAQGHVDTLRAGDWTGNLLTTLTSRANVTLRGSLCSFILLFMLLPALKLDNLIVLDQRENHLLCIHSLWPYAYNYIFAVQIIVFEHLKQLLPHYKSPEVLRLTTIYKEGGERSEGPDAQCTGKHKVYYNKENNTRQTKN